ncbi:MAG: hypothetical protein GY696_05395 [Gammaproteobacteria bacterium]|nr:hypothetical protein [Gammaproteobacteria bacterium]
MGNLFSSCCSSKHLLLLPIVFSSLAAHAGTVTTGTIAGNLSVNSTGAAVYSMPIEVPPGVSDMQPTLAISYKSGGSNGLLGKGAALSGFSVIYLGLLI